MSYERRRSADLTTRAAPCHTSTGFMERRVACRCGRCADCITRAAIIRDKAATRMAKGRAAKKAAGDRTEQDQRAAAMRTKRKSNEAAGDRTEQEHSAAAKRKKRAALEAAGDRTEQEQRAKAMQLKRAALRAAGDRTEQDKDTKARQLKRAALRESREEHQGEAVEACGASGEPPTNGLS